jgi:predicted RecA/RadA family phage recombinase
VAGTAAAAIFGRVFTREGGGGLKGQAWGEWDISGILVGPAGMTQVSNTLGRRLGDCTTVNKTLTVTVDGGAPVNVVFSGNHTTDSNATILGLINAALGSAATASEYSVSQGETYPTFPDREVTVRNDGTVGIPRFAAVRTSPATGRAIRIHGTADPVSVFAGVALEPIPPGKTGRVLRSGLLNTPTQLYGLNSGLAVGAALYLSDSTAGAFSATGSRQVLVGHHTDWARF